jgi:hypothetical protein
MADQCSGIPASRFVSYYSRYKIKRYTHFCEHGRYRAT